jgi:hypothetical protein
MKKLTILLFSILISFNSYGEWTELGKSELGTTHYIDEHSIKKHGGYVYWWHLNDRLKPNKSGDMSIESYYQGDCGVNRFKVLSYIFYKQPMGSRGTGDTITPPDKWTYPTPDSVGGGLLKYVCDYVK